MTTTDVPIKWMTLAEGAAHARCSTVTLRRELRAGRLRGYRLATRRSWRLQAADIDKWISGGSANEPELYVSPHAEQVKGEPR